MIFAVSVALIALCGAQNQPQLMNQIPPGGFLNGQVPLNNQQPFGPNSPFNNNNNGGGFGFGQFPDGQGGFQSSTGPSGSGHYQGPNGGWSYSYHSSGTCYKTIPGNVWAVALLVAAATLGWNNLV